MTRPKTNPRNDRVKRDYLIWLKDAKQRSDATVDQARHAIDRLETYTGYKDFGTFNKEQARAFKQDLMGTKAQRSGKPLSISTIYHTLQAIKEFLAWLHGRKEYRNRIIPANIDYLSLTLGQERQAHATNPKKYATLDEYRKALFAMPTGTEIERRDQALIALLLLTCMRDAAVVTLKLKHIDITRQRVFQDPRQVKTKFSKTIETIFIPIVGEDVETIVRAWVNFLAIKKGFGPDDPLFPKTVNGQDEHHNFAPVGLSREHWASATPVRQLFRTAFERVGLPYVNPHSIRNTLTHLAYQLRLDGEQLKALSQNIGHDSPLTTLTNYGPLPIERQAELIRNLGQKPSTVASDEAMADKIAEKLAAKLEAHRQPRTFDGRYPLLPNNRL